MINARDGKFQEESLALQKELTVKLEQAFSTFTQRRQLFTPQTFDTMVTHLGLPADKTEALRRLANQAIIAVNDTKAEKAIHNNQLGYGLNQLMHAKSESNPTDRMRTVQSGIGAIENAMPHIHAMVRYQAHHALADLRTEEAKTFRLLSDSQQAIVSEGLANYHRKMASKEGTLSHFASGLLEGFIQYQNEQFTATQSRDLKRLLNAVAHDVRPFVLALKNDIERKQVLYAKLDVLSAQQQALKPVIRE
ncbi:MAG: hypothetical protein H2174_05265 [Vampirovibrio sp.]|nr:hypothetical protein [Vampirovibrio sp.]MCS6266927.1 hypothetical protein [Vampirovibrio sp.]MCS6266955.1 hypothetical protein [Vampirovibrio sp.]